VSELNEHAEEMPSNPVANTLIAVATRYLTTCNSVRSHSEAFYEGFTTIYLAEIRQFTCQTTAGLWLEHSDEAHRAGSYHFADEIPRAYAARKQRGYFRLPDADAVRQYVESEPSNDVV
jgi:hypothetical protein